MSDLLRIENNLDEAYELCEKAAEIAEKEVKTSAWVSASIYKMGRVRLLQGKYEEAWYDQSFHMFIHR